MTRSRPGSRARALAVAAALGASVALAGCGGGGSADHGTSTDSAGNVYRIAWSTGFDSSSDGAGFSEPSGTTHGDCVRSTRDGAAYYQWRASAADGGSTRCYPDELFAHESGGTWKDPVRGPWVFTGRFRVDMRHPEQLKDDFLSLITFQVAPPVDEPGGTQNRWKAVMTVNVGWDAATGRPVLNVYHVPGDNQGDYRQRDERSFPLGRWVAIRVEWDQGNDIRVYQDGDLVISAHKDAGVDASGAPLAIPDAELYGMHLGGYAGARVTDWTIGNDDAAVALRR